MLYSYLKATWPFLYKLTSHAIHSWCTSIQSHPESIAYAIQYIEVLVQERRNSSALAMGLRLSCTNLSTYNWMQPTLFTHNQSLVFYAQLKTTHPFHSKLPPCGTPTTESNSLFPIKNHFLCHTRKSRQAISFHQITSLWWHTCIWRQPTPPPHNLASPAMMCSIICAHQKTAQ